MNSFYGLYIKIIRSDLEISSKDLAKQLNYSAPNLSRIEKGQQECTHETFMAAVDAFSKVDPHYIFNSSKQLKAEALQTLKSFLRNHMSGFQAEGLREIRSFITPADRLHSYAYFEVRLLNLIQDYFLEKDISEIQEIYEWIETYDCSFLPEEFVFIVYELSGLDAVKRRDFGAAERFFKKAQIIGGHFQHPGYRALAQLHTIEVFQSQMEHARALLLFDECQAGFAKMGAFRWGIQLDLLKGKTYVMLRRYDLAQELFSKAEKQMQQIPLPSGKRQLAQNRAWMDLKMGEYRECLNNVQEARSYSSTLSSLSIARVWSTWKLCNKKETADVIRQELGNLSKKGQEDFVRNVLLLLRYYLTDNERLLLLTYDKLMNQIKKYPDLDADLLVYDLMTDYYVKKEEYKEAIVYERKKIAYLKK